MELCSVFARLLHRFSMFSASNRHFSATGLKTPKAPWREATVTGPCASAHFATTKGIDHEASSHSSRDRYGGRNRPRVRIRRVRRDAHPRSHVWSARLQLCTDDGIFRDAQSLSHGRWNVRGGYGHDDFARCLTVLGMTAPSNKAASGTFTCRPSGLAVCPELSDR